MNILFLGDIVGNSGCSAVKKFLPNIIKSKKINFVIANGENAAKEGVGITENIVNELSRLLLSQGLDKEKQYSLSLKSNGQIDLTKSKSIIKEH